MGLLFVKTADGKKKPSVWVYLFILLLVIGASAFFMVGDRVTGFDKVLKTDKAVEADMQTGDDAPPLIDMEQSNIEQDGLDAEAVNAMNKQVAREKGENNGWISEDRIREIKEKYQEETKQRTLSNFQPTVGDRLADFEDAPPPPPPVLPENIEKVDKPQRFMTLQERLAAEGIESGSTGGDSSSEFGIPEKVEEQQKKMENTRLGIPETLSGDEKMKNILPLGTFIPCVLESDIVTTDLQSTVWATVVLDVTFRRQLQLPKGLVRLRGKTASEPVQNMVDIYFDAMLFSDGTELPIEAFAYAAFDPRYPNRFKIRGVPGEMIVPPLYVKLQGLVYSAALGASDAYIQNYINENTTTPTSFQTVPTVNPITGQVETVIQEQQGAPVNNNIGGTVALSAGQAALTEWVEEAKQDLEKYRPYVVVEKGTPIFVQLEATVDVSKRAVNGVAKAQAEAMANGGMRMGGINPAENFAPGDARAKYTGSADTGSTGIQGDIAKASNDFLKQLQNVGPSDTSSLQQAQETLQRAQQSSGQSQSPTDLQQILQQIGGN
jgi:hypothetical protein